MTHCQAYEASNQKDDFPKLGCVNHDCHKCQKSREPMRKWVGLTDEEIRTIDTSEFWNDHTPLDFARVIEAKLQQLNQCNGSANGSSHERT